MSRLPDKLDFPGVDKRLAALSKPGRAPGATVKLPSREDLGSRPDVRSQRGVFPFRADIAQTAEAKGIRQVGKATTEAFDAVQDELERIGKESEDRAGRDLDTEYADGIRKLQYGDGSDQNQGYFSLKGQAAVDASQGHAEAIEKLHKGMMAKVPSKRVGRLVNRSFGARRLSALDSGARHFANQHRFANSVSFDANQLAIRDDAIVAGAAGNAEDVEELAVRAGAQAAIFAKTTGADPKTEAQAAISGIFISEIERRALIDVASARRYFEEHKDSIDGRKHNAIEATLKRLERLDDIETRRAVADAVAVLDFGKIPANLAAVGALAKGTKHDSVLIAAVEDRHAARDFVQSPVADQARQLKRFAASSTATRRGVELHQRLARSHAQIVTGAEQGHGLAMAVQAGVIEEPAALDFSDPASLRLRAAQAEVAGQWLGRRVSPLSPAEADGLVKAVDDATASEVTGLLRGLSDGFGQDQAIALAGEIAENRPELAVAITLAGDVPILAREIILGGRLARETPDVLPGKTDRIAAVEEVVGNLFTPETAGVLDSFMDAAGALYAARKVPTGDLTFDGDVFEQALRDVMGGPIEFNKRIILPPVPGMSEDAFEDLVKRLTQPDLIEFGNGVPLFANGDPFTVDLFDRGFFATDAQFVTSGFGRYMVFLDGLGFVLADGGGAYEIDLRRFSQ